MYSRDRTGPGGKTYWTCTRKPRGSCRARLHSTGDQEHLRVTKAGDHDHEEAVATSIMKDDLCKKATTNPTKQLKELYRDYVNSEERPNQDDEDFMVPTLNSCRSQMYRARRRNMPTLPKTRAEINLEDEQWTKTNSNQQFLLHQDDQQLIYGTEENLRLLSHADTVYMDGTFSVAPRLFYQLYTLHICFRGFFLPLIYALLPDKTKDTYYDMFSIIKRKMANLDLQFNPTAMMSDFEIGMISTLRLHFPNTELKGCNFHFSQAIWRQTQQLGLTVSYHENINIRRIIRSLMTLPYIPRNWVRHQYRTIMGMTDADTDSVERLLQYFRSTWLDGQSPSATMECFWG